MTLNIDNAGNVSLAGRAVTSEAFWQEAKPKAPDEERAPAFDVPFDATYANRGGFDESFLGKNVTVYLPTLSSALTAVAAPLIASPKDNVLKYFNYSVVMHAKRRFAIYSAANVRHNQRYKMGRPADVWRTDPRILAEHQVSNFYYKSNQFDRGHLTRREDLEFGKTAVVAPESAADTCHWTNCTPQHAKFNQGKSLWQGLEGYVLEQGLIKGNFEVQVFTGPILEEDDPVYKPYPQIQYPVRFWKVLAVLDENDELVATAYILDQSEVIAQYGIEEAAPYGAYQTFQVAIEEVERFTGLTFTCDLNGNPGQLRDHDPLPKNPTPRRRRTVRTGESAVIDSPEGYRSLLDLGDVILK